MLRHYNPLGQALQVSVRDGQEVDRARLRSSLDIFVEMLEANLKLLVQRASALADGPTSALCACPPPLCGVPEPCEVVHATANL